jgi:hypothetical protein
MEASVLCFLEPGYDMGAPDLFLKPGVTEVVEMRGNRRMRA